MWFGNEAYKQLFDYIKPYSCHGDLTAKDSNTTAIVHSLMHNDIDSVEQLKALTNEDISKLPYVGPLRADIVRRARDGGDPTIKGDFTKTLSIEYKLPFKTSEEFEKWRDEADHDFIDACDICPIAKLCDLFCTVETELEIEDQNIGCSKMYEIILANVKKEDN